MRLSWLAQCFMNRFAERIIEMGFPTQDQGKVINRVVAVVHEHHDVIQDSGIQVLCFIKENLTEMEQTVIRMRYGLFGTKEHTQREIAEKLGISRSYVSRIEKRAVGHMREAFYEPAGNTL